MKGKTAGLLVLGMPEKAAEKSDDAEKTPKSGRVSAMKALLRAINADDPVKMDEALALHASLCRAESDEDEGEDY